MMLVQHREELYNNFGAAGCAVPLSVQHQTPELNHIDKDCLKKALAPPTSRKSMFLASAHGDWKQYDEVMKFVGRAWPLKFEYLDFDLKLNQMRHIIEKNLVKSATKYLRKLQGTSTPTRKGSPRRRRLPLWPIRRSCGSWKL